MVMDAGIATEENLSLIKGKGFNYLCVSRSKPKDYTLAEDHRTVIVRDSRKQEITLIVRRMSAQKLVTTEALNAVGDKVELRQCSEPSKQAREIYCLLGYKEAPFKKIKICRSQPPDAEPRNADGWRNPPNGE